jgi:excinuclease ABC subunit A
MAKAIREGESRRKDAANSLIKSPARNVYGNGIIKIRGLRTNNLKDIDVDIPLDEITAVTGVSGSGKTSLVYDTLYNTSRFYFSQTFSTYVRGLLGGHRQGDYRSATGILPSIAIGQINRQDNPRSTMGTITGILHILRLFFSRFSIDEKGQRPDLLARQFSFNDKSGACFTCGGLGTVMATDSKKLITNTQLAVNDGAFGGTRPGRFFTDPDGQYMAVLKSVGEKHNIDFFIPWDGLGTKEREVILNGTGPEEYDVVWQFKRKNRTGSHRFRSNWKGLARLVEEEYVKREGTTRQAGIAEAMKSVQCPACMGDRFSPERLKYQLGGRNIAEWLKLNVDDFILNMENLLTGKTNTHLSSEEMFFIGNSAENIITILKSLSSLGMGYIQLSRTVSSLSSGEYQRARLAAQLGSQLCGLLYILDEPSAALHPANLDNLWKVLRSIVDEGNTLLFVDHNPLLYRRSDNIVELGPGGGDEGGQIISFITGKDKSDKMSGIFPDLPLPVERKDFNPGSSLLSLESLNSNNLKINKINVPEGWICIAGVSGSGKSTLAGEFTAYLTSHVSGCNILLPAKDVSGWPWHQNPLTGLGLFDQMRKEFCRMITDGDPALKPDFFLLNRKGGRCEECQGRGYRSISLDYLGESRLNCDYCEGTGYNAQARSFRAGGHTFDEFMDMSISMLYDNNYFPSINDQLGKAVRMGLGYIKSGQGADTLSPGEKQRILLVREYISEKPGKNIFLFDEPSRGLHIKDTRRFMDLINQLVERGNSVIMVEHNPILINNSDWVIELGPGGGDDGGKVIFEGPPSGMAGNNKTPTSAVMNQLWNRLY